MMDTTKRKKISEYKESPCQICIINVICTKSTSENTTCSAYDNFILDQIRKCVNRAKKFYNK